MNDNEIIKALEAIEPTEFEKLPAVYMEFEIVKEILDLIKRQQAEIERLKKVSDIRLECLGRSRAKAKSEAYKEFAERLKEVYTLHEGLHIEIDNIVKEKTEESK